MEPLSDRATTRSTDAATRGFLRRSRPRGLSGPLAKLGSLAKFAAIFVAFGGYALIWGWRFALGLIILIFLHEMGHFLEAYANAFILPGRSSPPFLGAYVKYTRGNPWQTARVALAGPLLGGVAALACYLLAARDGLPTCPRSRWLYFGFFLNLVNLLPFGILDGGAVVALICWLWLRRRAGEGLAAPVRSLRRRRSHPRRGSVRRFYLCRSTGSVIDDSSASSIRAATRPTERAVREDLTAGFFARASST